MATLQNLLTNTPIVIDIKIEGADNVSKQLKGVTRQLVQLGASSRRTMNELNTLEMALNKQVVSLGALATALYGVGYASLSLMKKGIQLNRMIEAQTLGISALISANTKLTLSNGLQANSYDRLIFSQEKAYQTVMKIKKASTDTVATFPELLDIFNNAIGRALSSGKSMGKDLDEIIDNTIKLAIRFSNIAGSIGMPMRMVREEIRSTIEGNITVNTRIAKMLNITNQAINEARKKENGLVKYLNKQLQDFDVLETEMTFNKLVAKISDSFDTIRTEASKPLFNELYDQLTNVNDWLNDNKSHIIDYLNTLSKYSITVGYAF
jgi:ABC-type transporter Mla subunit MlaD